jgi:DNA helicase-2/ATP-dependent DNA helicase PcrA
VTDPTPAQLEAVAHPRGPLLVLGGAGTGKTELLADRFAWLAAHGTAPEAILVLGVTPATATDLRERIEARVTAPYEELCVTTFRDLCARLLRDEALEAGLDPFATPVAPGDRLATLLERIDELPLASHDLRGNPSALLGSIVGRIDRLKDELVTAEDYAAWASTLPEETEPDRARAAREREFGAIYAAHDRMLAEAGTLDYGDLVVHAFRLLREKPHVRARLAGRYAHVLVDDFQDASFARRCSCGCSPRSTPRSPSRPTTTRRSPASAAPRRRASPTSAPTGQTPRSCSSRIRTGRPSACSRPRAR